MGVFGRGGDQRNQAVLDAWEERVLLGFGKTVRLVEEQHGPPAGHAELGTRLFHDRAYVLHPSRDGGEFDKPPVGGGADEEGQGRLARPRRPPEENGTGRCVRDRAATLDQTSQRRASSEEVVLSDDLA